MSRARDLRVQKHALLWLNQRNVVAALRYPWKWNSSNARLPQSARKRCWSNRDNLFFFDEFYMG